MLIPHAALQNLKLKPKDLLLIRKFVHRMKGRKRKIVNSPILRKSSKSWALQTWISGDFHTKNLVQIENFGQPQVSKYYPETGPFTYKTKESTLNV